MANQTIISAKEQSVNEVVAKINASKVVIAFDYQGLTVANFEALRKSVRAAGGEICVIKNNISRRAAALAGFEDFANVLNGPKAIIFSENEIAGPAKALYEFAKENQKVVISNAIVEGACVESSKVKELATLPSYETMLTMLAAGMLGTVSQLAIGLNLLAEKMEQAN